MKTTALTLLLFLLPFTAATAGWEYYVLDEQGEWVRVMPRDLDLEVPRPGGSRGPEKRMMIIYDRTVDKEKEVRENWIPEVSRDLVEAVEGK